MIKLVEVNAERCAKVLPKPFSLTLDRRWWRRRLCHRGFDQLRYDQALAIHLRVISPLARRFGRGFRADQFINVRVVVLVLTERIERVKIIKRIIRNDAARGLRQADFNVKAGRVTNQPGADFKVAQHIGRPTLDAQRFTLGQARTGVTVLNTVAAGVGQVKHTVAVTDQRVAVGQVTLAVRNDPIAILTAPDHATAGGEGFLAQLCRHELLGVQHFENQFHDLAPCGHLPRLTACGSPNGR